MLIRLFALHSHTVGNNRIKFIFVKNIFMIDNAFDKLRPYTDNEIPAAVNRIIEHKSFPQLCKMLYPNKPIEEIANILRSFDTIYDFQKNFALRMVLRIIETTTNGLTHSGLENVTDVNNFAHLLVANHRDIVLDAALMQAVFTENDLHTTQITVGDNLMTDQLFIDLAKLNKMFTLIRGGSKIQMYRNAILHSEYIRNLITNENESLWIAQRDGRTKDGNDKTQQGLIKMLIGNRKDFVQALRELNIVPVTISYEFESCAKSKTREIYISKHKEYQKDGNEDMKSVMAGFTTFKGRIHISFGKNINPILDKIKNSDLPNTEIVDIVVNELDKQFYANYKLWPNNYIAFDILNNTNKYESEYTSGEKDTFVKYTEKIINEIEFKDPEIKTILLGIYANPLKNKISLN